MSPGVVSDMRRRTVRFGIHLIIAAVIVIAAVTFFHETLAGWFGFSPAEEERLVYQGFFWGGLSGGCGVTVTALGLVFGSERAGDARIPLAPPLIVLGAVVFVFVLLFVASFRTYHIQDLRPGETITI